MRLRRSAAAQNDLDDIWFFVAQESQVAADRVILRLEAATAPLAEFPLMGTSREDLAPGLRALRVDNYVVFYFVMANELRVARVLHARLDATSVRF